MYRKFTGFKIIVLVLLINIFCSKLSDNKEYIAKVDVHIISSSEFKNFMNRNRAMIYNYFYENYKDVDSADFWTRKFGDETPIERLKKVTLNECVRIKIQQILAKEKKLIDDISFILKLPPINEGVE